MRAIVVGAGQMGRAIAHGLNHLGHNVTVADVNYKALEDISDKNFALVATKEFIALFEYRSGFNEAPNTKVFNLIY